MLRARLDRNAMIEGLQGRGRVQGPPPYDANVVRPRPPAIGNFIALEHPIEDLMVQMRLIASRREQREAYEFEQRYPLFQYTENNDFEVHDIEDEKDEMQHDYNFHI